jgi:glycosyltransferase involved in cell wall biosynthesis
MFYIFCNSIVPNTASGNRFLSFLRGFDELDVDATVVLLTSYMGYKIEEKYNHLNVEYLWKKWPFGRRVLNRLHTPIAFRQFLSRLNGGDIVYCVGSAGYLHHFTSTKGIRVYHERTESPDVLSLPTQKQQERYLKACTELDGLFVISTALKAYFVEKGLAEDKIQIVNMTVDHHRFASLRKNNTVEKYIAYCGTASNNKDGVDELIKAFGIVAKKHFDVKLYIIGKTPSADDKAGNLRLINDLGLIEKVVFTGIVSANQMPQILKDATVLALDRPDSLQAQNGFPTKLGEYLLSENPVVVTKVGDIPKFLKDGESALLAEQRNPKEFASKICWAIEHSVEASIIGKKGKEVAMKEFNYLIESKKIVDVIGIIGR